jgi:uncharacterized protein (DUF58 family)
MSGALRSLLRYPFGRGTERTLGALFVIGVLGSVVFLLVASMTPLYGVGDTLYLVALALPTIGFVIGLAALVAFLRAAESGDVATPAETGRPSTSANTTIGDTLSRVLEQTRRRRYRGVTTASSERLHEMLVRAVGRALRRRDGLDSAGAERAIEEGSWTDDPVAAGFLSSERRMPLFERLRGAVDPGRAYRRRLDRTLDAIDRLDRPAASERDERAETPGAEGGLTETVFAGELPEGQRTQRTAAWGALLGLLLAGAGIAIGRPVLVVGATLGLWYVAAGVVASSPAGSVELTRRVSTASGDPGDLVTVETTVRNTGDGPLVDLSVVDGVPEDLPVRAGSHRACLALAPGEAEQFTYELELRRGEFRFDPVSVRTSDLTGLVTEHRTVGEKSQQELSCVPAAEQVPLGDATNDYAGTIPADEGGRGVEFYSIREYEPGDPAVAIDWRRYAHRRELATVEFRAERATRIVCVVDCRESQQQAAAETRLPARDISVAAARRTVDTLFEAGHPTGLVTVGAASLRQIQPGTGSETRAAIDGLLDAELHDRAPQSGYIRTVSGQPGETLPQRLPGEAQVFLFSSLVDETSVDLAVRLCSRGFGVTVISPDVTAGIDDTPVRLAGIEREERLVRARAGGASVLDWDVGRPLRRVLNEAIRGGQP